MNFEQEALTVINLEHNGLSVSDYLQRLLKEWSIELARAECRTCRGGNFPAKRPHGKYAHRLPEGKHGGQIWVLCRATEIWQRVEELKDAERL